MAPPFRQCEFDILYDQGISKEGELLDIGSQLEIIEKSGAWYSFNKDRIGQGKDNARQFLKENPAVAAEIEKLIRDQIALLRPGGAVAIETDESLPEEAEA
jgi:recombination protein RecA